MTVTDRSPERLRLGGHALVEKAKELIHEGNVRRIIVKNDKGHTVLEVPVTAGVIALVAAPVITAIGAIAALAGEWTIEVERQEDTTEAKEVVQQDRDVKA